MNSSLVLQQPHAVPAPVREPNLRRVLRVFRDVRVYERALAAILILNLFDATFTLLWVSSGLATEANPIMAYVLGIGPGAFLFTKLGVVTLAVGLLARYPRRLAARFGVLPVLLVYGCVVATHLAFTLVQAFEAMPLVLAWL
jgi:hypothetical protein